MLLRSTQISFYILVFSLPLVNVFSFNAMDQKVLISEPLFLLTFSLFLVSVITGKIELKANYFYLPLAFYGFALLISTVFSQNQQRSFVKLFGEFYLLGLAIVSFNLVRSVRTFKKTAFVWIAATFLVSTLSMVTFILFYADRSNFILLYTLSIYGTLPVANYPRIQSTFLNPNMLCNYLTISCAILLAAFKLNWIKRSIFFSFMFLLGFAAIFSISPGLGGVGLAIGIWTWLSSRNRKSVYGKLALSGAFAFALLFFVSTTIVPVFPAAEGDASKTNSKKISFEPSIRFLAWRNSLKTFYQYPLVGKGLDSDVAETSFVVPSGNHIYITDSHQMWLNVLGQSGLLGFSAILFLSFLFVRKSLPYGLADDFATIRTALSIAFVSAFIYQGLSGSFENARHVWVLIGILGSFSFANFDRETES